MLYGKILRCFTTLAFALAISAYETGGRGDSDQQERVGTLIGVLAGAYIGSRFGKGTGKALTTVAGAALGATLKKSQNSSLSHCSLPE